MSSDWPFVPFRSLLKEQVRNGIYKPKEFHGRGAKIVNMGELFGHPRLRGIAMKRVELNDSELSRFSLSSGDLIFARRSLVAEGAGKCSIVLEVTEDTTFESSIIRARLDRNEAEPLFLYYYFSSPIGFQALDSIRRQVAVAGITGSDLSELPTPKPPLSEQKSIASILSTLDEKIELNRRMNETLQALAQAIFKDWLITFSPTRRKVEGATDPVAILGGLIPDPAKAAPLAGLFPDRFGEDGLPEGWEDKSLDEVAVFLNGLALQKYPPTGENDLPAIKIAELRGGITAKTNRANRSIADKYLIKDGDFLFSWSGSLMAKFWTAGEGALNQHLFKVSSVTHPRWFYSQWVHRHMAEFQTIAASKATTMGHIQRGHLSTARVIAPPTSTLEAMTAVFEPLIERTIHNDLEIRTLAGTRDYLMPKLMSGAVRVRDVQKAVS